MSTSATEEDINPYELLGVTTESSEQEIRTAYRQRSLKVHPDRNRGNPDAARKFHELNQAYELLLDPLRRMALDAKVRLKEARKARYAQYDAKRKNLVDELEERERAFKKSKLEKEEKKKEMWRENERLMEEGRLMREAKAKELQRREEEALQASRKAKAELEPPALGALDTTVRLKYPLSSHPNLTTPESITTLLRPFGTIDSSSIVISLKPSPPKKPKRGIALVPFKQIGDAFAAVCASGREEQGLKDVEVSWAEGKEPELIEWLKKMGKLGSGSGSNSASAARETSQSTSTSAPSSTTKATADNDLSPFSSFPSTFPDLSSAPTFSTPTNAAGLDYESLTLMRLRQAERERLEREIQEQEAQEGS
ncbi:DnaJ-domain-containing protein [Panus rudis PR-1116 ss-1]|nr:DnaJ-domain-containing protein [Panus rudis PR-1116 ss-1]